MNKLVAILSALFLVLTVTASELTESRMQLETRLGGLEPACREAPGEVDARRAYADALFKLGNIWQANDVIAPLVTPQSTNQRSA